MNGLIATRSSLAWRCPQCHEWTVFPNDGAKTLATRSGGCQGCRARVTFEKKPELIEVFLGFWDRVGYPVSSSWANAIVVRG